MEFGPRALGNRSILADPRNPNIKKLLKELKNEAKKRANIEDAAYIYFEKASENIK